METANRAASAGVGVTRGALFSLPVCAAVWAGVVYGVVQLVGGVQ